MNGPERRSRSSGALRIWLFPLSLLLGSALAIFAISFLVDALSASDPRSALDLLLRPRPESALQMLSNAGEVVAAVLAIAITVVAIVLELASNRYTHRVTELFIREPANFAIIGFFVVTALQSLWVSLVFDEGFVPRVSVTITILMITACLVLLLPYFAFVFHFLQPEEIVRRIRETAMRAIENSARPLAARKAGAMRAIEQLSDVALNAIENKDKAICIASVDAMRTLVSDYARRRAQLSEDWFAIDGEIARNPDFVSMAPDVLADVTRRRIWLELKVLRQYQTVYNEALNRIRDIDHVVAIHSRQIAEEATRNANDELVGLAIKFFNTYLRATINARDVRTAYNVLNQYRLLAEALLGAGTKHRVVEIARHFKYYGRVAFDQKLPFILETVAYDLCSLNARAFDNASDATREILRIVLEIDKESESEVQEASLRGVRKAQLKLATHFLGKGDESLAREVFRDMETERPERLISIRDELRSVDSAEFWEVNDRGHNFDYLTPDGKEQLERFFGWFGDRLGRRA